MTLAEALAKIAELQTKLDKKQAKIDKLKVRIAKIRSWFPAQGDLTPIPAVMVKATGKGLGGAVRMLHDEVSGLDTDANAAEI